MPTTTTTTTTTTTSYAVSQNRQSGASPARTTGVSAAPAGQEQVHHHPHTDGTIQTMHDAQKQHELGHGYGETEEQHAAHAQVAPVHHWGLNEKQEELLFYAWVIPSWMLEIAGGILASYFSSGYHGAIITISVFLFFSWAAWWQTAVQMMQRASWVRDEGNLPDRRRFLHLAVRLNRMMVPTAVFAFCFFIVAYVRRKDTDDIATWLIFLIVFIMNTVCSVMNAYNNITWESDRLEYEEGSSPYGNTLLAILGIPTKPRKQVEHDE